MKKKEIKITEKEQRVAVDILQELEIWMMSRPGNSDLSESEQQIYDIFNKMFKKYKIKTFDTSYDREKVLNSIIDNLDDLENK